MNKSVTQILGFLVFIVVIGYVYNSDDKETAIAFQSMNDQARSTIQEYLDKNKYTESGLSKFPYNIKDNKTYQYSDLAGNICIDFVIHCEIEIGCYDLQKYPYHEHGEKCPWPNQNT